MSTAPLSFPPPNNPHNGQGYSTFRNVSNFCSRFAPSPDPPLRPPELRSSFYIFVFTRCSRSAIIFSTSRPVPATPPPRSSPPKSSYWHKKWHSLWSFFILNSSLAMLFSGPRPMGKGVSVLSLLLHRLSHGVCPPPRLGEPHSAPSFSTIPVMISSPRRFFEAAALYSHSRYPANGCRTEVLLPFPAPINQVLVPPPPPMVFPTSQSNLSFVDHFMIVSLPSTPLPDPKGIPLR